MLRSTLDVPPNSCAHRTQSATKLHYETPPTALERSLPRWLKIYRLIKNDATTIYSTAQPRQPVTRFRHTTVIKSSTGRHFNATRIVNDTRYAYCVKKQVLRLGWKKTFVKGGKRDTSRATAEKAKITKGGGGTLSVWAYSLHVRVAYIMSHGNTRLFSLPLFFPFSNNIIEKNHTINWAMMTEGVSWQREGGFIYKEGGT